LFSYQGDQNGIFKNLPLLRLAPIQLPTLQWQLKICPNILSGAIILPVLALLLSNSACHGGSARGKDVPAPGSILLPLDAISSHCRHLQPLINKNLT